MINQTPKFPIGIRSAIDYFFMRDKVESTFGQRVHHIEVDGQPMAALIFEGNKFIAAWVQGTEQHNNFTTHPHVEMLCYDYEISDFVLELGIADGGLMAMKMAIYFGIYPDKLLSTLKEVDGPSAVQKKLSREVIDLVELAYTHKIHDLETTVGFVLDRPPVPAASPKHHPTLGDVKTLLGRSHSMDDGRPPIGKAMTEADVEEGLTGLRLMISPEMRRRLELEPHQALITVCSMSRKGNIFTVEALAEDRTKVTFCINLGKELKAPHLTVPLTEMAIDVSHPRK